MEFPYLRLSDDLNLAKINDEALFLTIDYLDLYLNKTSKQIGEKELILTSGTCLYMASKFLNNDFHFFSLNDVVKNILQYNFNM